MTDTSHFDTRDGDKHGTFRSNVYAHHAPKVGIFVRTMLTADAGLATHCGTALTCSHDRPQPFVVRACTIVTCAFGKWCVSVQASWVRVGRVMCVHFGAWRIHTW